MLHRDISPRNVLISPQGLVKLADFGHSRLGVSNAGGGEPVLARHLTPNVGTPWYRSPEVLFGSRSYGTASDMWSTACVACQLLAGRPLFTGSTDISQIASILELRGGFQTGWPGISQLPDWGKLNFPEPPAQPLADVLPGLCPSALQLFEWMLQYDPGGGL